MNNELFDFIKSCPTQYQAASVTAEILIKNGFRELSEKDAFLSDAGKFFIRRNGSSLIAFKLNGNIAPFMLSACHGDSPTFRIKENGVVQANGYTSLATEKYGGPLLASWFDRPLSLAGRITQKTDNGFKSVSVDLKEPVAVIPSVATHFDLNQGYDLKCDLLPIAKSSPKALVADMLNINEEDILTSELYLYPVFDGMEIGDYIISPRLDDLGCAFASLMAFIDAKDESAIPVMCLFDNEEVGSTTKQGAASTFLFDVLERISKHFNAELSSLLPESFLLSCDNGHAVHPNHPELSDKTHSVYLNKGVVIKHNANQKYTTDGISAALCKYILEKENIPYQEYFNRADLRGGSTLGNILNTQVSLNTADVGMPQLAMHSAIETAGARDLEYMHAFLKKFFESRISTDGTNYEI